MTSTATMMMPTKPPPSPASNAATAKDTSRADAARNAQGATETAETEDANAIADQFAALLQSMGFVVQNVNKADANSATSFGRGFNWDPTMMVVDAETGEQVSLDSIFPADVLQSLVPGLPMQDAMAAPMAPAPAPDAAAVLPAVDAASAKAPVAPIVTPPPQTAETAPIIATGLPIPVLDEAASLIPAATATQTKSDGTPVATVSLTAPPAGPALAAANAPVQSDVAAKQTAQATHTVNKWFDAAKADLTAFGEDGVTVMPQTSAAPQVAPAAPAGKLAGATMLAAQQVPADADAKGSLDLAATSTGSFTAHLDGDLMVGPGASAVSQPGVTAATLTQTSAAGASHPSTQVLAAAMQAASGDKPKSFTVALNPSELGRVIVDMKMAADKKMKITMTVEKDTTYNLLQRDGQSLQGLLDKAGIAKDADVSFQLASDQQSFDQAAGDRGAFQPDNAPSFRLAESASTALDADAALPTSVWQDAGDGRYQVNRLI